ncbi:MAG: lysophospholipid acyltransferase family protein [Ignavibacteriaceae bacterium]
MLSYLKLIFIVLHTIVCSIIALILSLVDRSFKSYFRLSRIFSKVILVVSGIKIEVSGLENVDKNSVYIFVSNHSSQFDIPALQYTIPVSASIVYKKEIGNIPLFGWQMRLGPYIMIDRQNIESALKSIERAKRLMSQKKFSVLLFAEGTRSKTGEVQSFKRGAFYLASHVGFPIIPVTLSGTDKILPKGKFKIKKGTIYVHFDKPVLTENLSSRKDEIELMEKVRNIVIQNIKKEN